MSVDTKGIIVIDDEDKNKDIFKIVDQIQEGVRDFYNSKLKSEMIKKNFKMSERRMLNAAFLPEEDQKKYSAPRIDYSFAGVFSISVGYPSKTSPDGMESRHISVHMRSYENDIKQYLEVEDENVKNQGIILSLNRSGEADELLVSILNKFGDDHPSYLLRSDCEDLEHNIVKVGSAAPKTNEMIATVPYLSQEYGLQRIEEVKKYIKDSKPEVSNSVENDDQKRKRKVSKPRP